MSAEVILKAKDVCTLATCGGSSEPALMSSRTIIIKKGHREALQAISRPPIGFGKVGLLSSGASVARRAQAGLPALQHSRLRLKVLSHRRRLHSLSPTAGPQLGFL